MSGLFGSSVKNVTPDYTGLQTQTAVNTLPVPILWGMTKIAPNVIWYNNFQQHQGPGGTGKSGWFATGSQTVNYTADVIMALCEGPISSINTIWRGQSIYYLAELNLVLFVGTTPQSIWGYLQSVYPSQALAYQGTAYLGGASYQLTSSATLDNHNFEVQGLRYGTGWGQTPYQVYVSEIYPNVVFGNSQQAVYSSLPWNGNVPSTGYFDADPALCIADFLTSLQFGVGFPTSSIDTTTLYTQSGHNDSAYQTYCRAVGLAISPALTSQETASSILARWLQLTNTAAVWSNGQLQFIPYGDSVVTGNGVTFTPNVTPIYNITDDDFLIEDKADPLQVSRSDLLESYNVWRLEISDRANQYALTTIEARDQHSIDLVAQLTGTNGIRLAPTVTAHEICDSGVANISAQLILQRAVYIRNTYKFRVDWGLCLLDPMDLVTVTDAALGLNNEVIRITEIEEDENGYLEITAEEFPQGVASAVLYPTPTISNALLNRNAGAGSATATLIFEPTDELGGGLELWIGACSDNPLCGGFQVWMSYQEDGNYQQIGTVGGSAKLGVTTATFPAVPVNPTAATTDSLNTLSVDLSESLGVLPAASSADLQALDTPCYVGGEVVCFGASTLTSANEYNLNNFIRGAFGTESQITTHPAGTQFAFLDDTFCKFAYPQNAIGQTLYFKFPSFNIFGGGLQSLADVGAVSYFVTGSALLSPLPNIASIYANYEAGFQKIYWTEITDFRSGILYEIRQGPTWAGGLFLATQAHPPFIAPGIGTYWVSPRCQPVPGQIVYSEQPVSIVISGNQLSLTYSIRYDEAASSYPGSADYGLSASGSSLSAYLNVNAVAASNVTSGNSLPLLSLPSVVTFGFAVADVTNGSAIPSGASVLSASINGGDYGPVQQTVMDTVTVVDEGSVTVSPTSTIDYGLVTSAAVTVLLSTDITGVTAGDVISFAGVPINVSLYYEVPVSHWLTSAYLANASINVSAAFAGEIVGSSFLAIPDFLGNPDFLGSTVTAFIDGWVEIASASTTSGVLPGWGPSPGKAIPAWGLWQDFVPGVFPGSAWKLRVGMTSSSPQAEPICSAFASNVSLPTRTDNYLNLSVPNTGLTIVFTPDGSTTPQAFNAGVNGSALPKLEVDWQATAGDTYVITGLSLSQVTITFYNGGIAVARSGVTVVAQGA